MERCGKINASNAGSDSWTGIGVVAGFCTVVLIMQWPHRRNGEVTWRSELLQRLQEVRGNCKTRNQLLLCQMRGQPLDSPPDYRKLWIEIEIFGISQLFIHRVDKEPEDRSNTLQTGWNTGQPIILQALTENF